MAMLLGAACWKAKESFYDGLTLARDGISVEQAAAVRPALAAMFPRYEQFWKRHVCPATNRPHGKDYRPDISDIVSLIGQTSYSILTNLVEAVDSLDKVRAGDLGPLYRNCRDVFVGGGNALQLLTELQYSIAGGNPRDPAAPSLAGELGTAIDPFPDWKSHWKADRDLTSIYRNYITHQGLPYTIHNQTTGEVLVLDHTRFTPGVRFTWKQAEASYTKNPGHWRPLRAVCADIFHETVAFIDLSYERLIGKMDAHLTSRAYQLLWGWRDGRDPTAACHVIRTAPAGMVSVSISACSASKTVISSGPCMP